MTTVHEVRLELDAERLKHYWRRVGRRRYDPGYRVKGALAGIFGELRDDHVLRPFFVCATKGRTIPVIGYSTYTADQLRLRAHQVGDPEAVSMLDERSVCSKELPRYWPKFLGFSVTAAPREDYQSRRSTVDPSLSRQEVYQEWLLREFAKDSGAKVVEASLIDITKITACRAGDPDAEGKRQEYEVKLDTLTLTGTIEVLDSTTFKKFLPLGIGRHRGFGYGMLKLRAPASSHGDARAYFAH